jgi:steroid delta-isomerase-like uncharacterized protein
MLNIERHFEALSRGDWETYKQDYADDSQYIEMSTGQSARGAENIAKLLQHWSRAFPDLRATVKSSAIVGDKGFAEIELSGTHSGPLEAPFGTIQATGRHGVVPAVVAMRVKGDKIEETRVYFDLMTLLRQMGVAERAGAAAEEGAPAVH